MWRDFMQLAAPLFNSLGKLSQFCIHLNDFGYMPIKLCDPLSGMQHGNSLLFVYPWH
jgi:hypothetical protein